MQLGIGTGIEPHTETLLERAVRRELARLDKITSDHDRPHAGRRPEPEARVERSPTLRRFRNAS